MGGKAVAVLLTGGAEVFVAVGCGGRVATVEVMIGTVGEAGGKVGIAVGVMTGGRGVGVAGGCRAQATSVRIANPKAALFFISLSPQSGLEQVYIAIKT
jgi:hypothetical protein